VRSERVHECMAGPHAVLMQHYNVLPHRCREWAFEHLLPGASKTVSFSLYHYGHYIHTDPQSNATLANVDFAVQQKAFIMNFDTPDTSSKPKQLLNPLFSKALQNMDPLFSAYGWTDKCDIYYYVCVFRPPQ
jgi:hypothetical protein